MRHILHPVAPNISWCLLTNKRYLLFEQRPLRLAVVENNFIVIKKLVQILVNTIPIIIMIGLIPLVANDYLLTAIDAIIIIIALAVKRNKNDITVLIFGFFIMIVAEYFFVMTGVETFSRNTLFGLMPLWLPFLWAYGYVAIKRAVEILE